MILAAILAAFCVYNFAEGETAAGIVLAAIFLSTVACAVGAFLEIGRYSGTEARINDLRFRIFHR